jgi:putative peptidoglycan lipid II flippase
VTGADFEALHYGLAQSTDWSAGTLHRSRAAQGDKHDDEPDDEPDGLDEQSPAHDHAAEGGAENRAENRAETAAADGGHLGVPGQLGLSARWPDDSVWGPTTYGGVRRYRPRLGRRRSDDRSRLDGMPGVVEDLPDLSGLSDAPATAWADLLDGAQPAGQPEPSERPGPAGQPGPAEPSARDTAIRPVPPTADPVPEAIAPTAGPVDAGPVDAGPSAADAAGAVDPASAPVEAGATNRGLLASSRTMAIASLASRVTGFLRTAAIAAALGVVGNGVADAYNLANMLPNMVYELLIGGVLSSVLIPLLVTAQESDHDKGAAYTHRLLSVATVALGIATLIAAAGAPVLTWMLVEAGPQRDLATVWATILLPEIFFYGLGALFTAVLNARHVYGAPAWAPVLNNVVILLTVAVYLLLPGPATLTPSSITTAQVLVLGIGTTLGIVVQAMVLIPALRRIGFRWRWRFTAPPGGRRGFREERGLVGWVLGYVAVSQIGLLVISRVALSNEGLTTFTSADLLFQVPYGILGVSLLTALMPRMSRSAARGDTRGVLADLSLGTRLSALALLPVTAGLMVLGPALGTIIFRYGQTPLEDARHVGIVLAMASFGLFPFAVVMLQLRVFYAMHDARTPTLINVGMVTAKIILVLGAAAVFDGRQVVQALSVATSASYVVGAVLGHFLLERRLGALGLGAAVPTVAKVAGSAVAGALVALLVVVGVEELLGQGRLAAFVTVLVGSAAGGGALVALLLRLRLPEVQEIAGALRRARPAPSDAPTPVG